MRIEYTVQIWKEGDAYVAHAMPLDIMSSGDSPEEARKALGEAVRLFLETASERGSLRAVLEECGYQPADDDWVSPGWVAIERQSTVLTG